MFRTKVEPAVSDSKIELWDPILSLGSCFAQSIGQKLTDFKFDISINPFGTLFNPLSIFKLVNQAALNEIIGSQGIVENQGVFHHYDLHSDMSKLDGEELLENVNRILTEVGNKLPDTSWFIYTFGTSIVYELKSTGEVVANCHKVPASEFNRRILDINEIVHAFKVNYELIKSISKYARFIITVSPVRHQKESFEQNNLSKSILRVACEKIIEEHSDVAYFPAFEIMMDELRDYRFYADDMLHPNELATNYIWEKFQEVYFGEREMEFIRKWQKIRKAIAHRPFNPDSEQHQLFVNKTILLLQEFKDMIDISPEQKILEEQLI
jgi:hypothetical protein